MRGSNSRFTEEAMEQNLAIVDRVRRVAERHGATPGQVALAWLLAQYDRVVPIPGTRRIERLTENAGAAGLQLSVEDLTSSTRCRRRWASATRCSRFAGRRRAGPRPKPA
jgi:aryl-alcohol dehydrogenase-like predicted oxidoreductase